MPKWYSAAVRGLRAAPPPGSGSVRFVRRTAGNRGRDRSCGAAAAPVVEAIENRQLLSVSTDAGGWTVITPPADARVIYVSSSSGNDASNGLSAGCAGADAREGGVARAKRLG